MDKIEYRHGGGHVNFLDEEQQSDLMDLNLAFLSRCTAPSLRHEISRPPPCGLESLDEHGIRRLAESPFALFRVQFPEKFASGEPTAVYWEYSTRETAALPLLAAAYCRSVASIGSEISSLVLGLSRRERDNLLACSINRLKEQECRGNLRLQANFLWTPRYWTGLVRAAKEPGEFILRSTRIQGIQLLAAAASGLNAMKR